MEIRRRAPSRLSDVDGQVQVAEGSQVLTPQAMVNTPLFEGSQVTTGDDGRAEIQFEDGSVARISPNSSVTLSVLRQQGSGMDTEVQLNNGLGYFEIQGGGSPSAMRVRFGDNAISSSGFTVLRVDLDNAPGKWLYFRAMRMSKAAVRYRLICMAVRASS